MSFWAILDNLLIGPLKLVFELIFSVALKFVSNPGLAIVFLSLAMNLLVLPLYRRADKIQEEARDVDLKLKNGVAHIKKTFSGDERMMILQTYYRQNNYKPTDVIKGSISLLLQIPFFMAAYQFLSNLEILDGVSLGPISDLGSPDGLLVIGGFTINLLPIIMTLVNVVSSAMYLKGFPLKSKIQLYGMALFFLVFLYNSPACLVFYWTLNNVFSLIKTTFYKLKNPGFIIRIITTLSGLFFIVFGGFLYEADGLKRKVFLLGIGVALLIPLALYLIKKYRKVEPKIKEYKPNRKIFVLGGLFLSVLIGVLIPSAFISSSPQEFIDISYFHNPLWYIVSAGSLAAGFFIVWFSVFYWLMAPKAKVLFEKGIWILCGVTLVNYMFFGTNLGIISSTLKYENDVAFDKISQLINVLIVLLVAAVMLFIIIKFKKATSFILAIVTVALMGMSAVNIFTIKSSVDLIVKADDEDALASFDLSKDGQNVVVIMLDRAINAYIPYIFNEKPELVEKFDGFTYYTNVLSYGGCTNFGSPPVFGGYEYTPVEMNKRDDEALVDKQNEALSVMPVLFDQHGFEVTVCDSPYANYQWIPDMSIFDEYEDIDAYLTKGTFGDEEEKQENINNNYRNFFMLSVMKSIPLFAQAAVYNRGEYNQIQDTDGSFTILSGYETSMAKGLYSPFMESYNVMDNLSEMTNIAEEEKNTFMYIANSMTHEPVLLQTPDYTPSETVDNREYDAANADRFTIDGKTLKVESLTQMAHYHVNMSAMLRLAEWFDYLRENDVYDNTRIIIVSDHGRALRQVEDLVIADSNYKDIQLNNPLLMVKDFNAEGFTTSDEFMTNADVPTLATVGVIENPVNPFTGNEINSDEKTAHEQFVILSSIWQVEQNNGNSFKEALWASVKDDVRDKTNWTFYPNMLVLKEHVIN